jgi:TrmH family RNA methyltransferase
VAEAAPMDSEAANEQAALCAYCNRRAVLLFLENFVQHISSKQNSLVRRLRSLRCAKGRADTGCFLVEGWNLLREATQNARVDAILVDEAKKQELSDMPLAQPKDAAVFCAPSFVLDYICETKTPQGVVASVHIPAGARVDRIQGNVLALDGVQDPGNVGTMIRTAEATGFGAVLLSLECADPFAPKTVRATMGSIFRVPVLRGDLLPLLAILQNNGFAVVSAEPRGMPVEKVLQADHRRFALVVGSEGNGISEGVLKLSDLHVALPMRGKVESLNAAVAAGVLMYALSFLQPDVPLSSHAK